MRTMRDVSGCVWAVSNSLSAIAGSMRDVKECMWAVSAYDRNLKTQILTWNEFINI